MYIGKHWINSNDDGTMEYLNKTNLNRIERGIEGAIGKKMDIPYYWAVNTKEIQNCASGDAWETGGWNNTTGTIGFDGYGQYAIYSVANSGMHFVFSANKNLTISESSVEFETTKAYIRWFYHISAEGLGYMSASSVIRLALCCDVEGTLTNYFYYDITKASLLGNDTNNEMKVLQSAFTSVGSPVWTVVKGISFQLIGTAPSSNFAMHVDAIHVCRADALNNNYANPMQRIHSWSGGSFYPDFSVQNANYVNFVGYGYSEGDLRTFNLTRNMVNRVLAGLKVEISAFVDGIFYCRFYAGTSNNTNTFCYYVDANNYVVAYVEAGNFILKKVVAGVSSSQSVAVSTITLNTTVVTIKMWKEADNYMAHLYLDDNMDVFWAWGTTASIGNTGSFYIGNDTATTSNPNHYTNIEFSAI
jgi:hypothetical protein